MTEEKPQEKLENGAQPLDAVLTELNLKNSDLVEKSTEQLVKYGGFDLLETVIEGVTNLNPSRKARKNILLVHAHNFPIPKKIE